MAKIIIETALGYVVYTRDIFGFPGTITFTRNIEDATHFTALLTDAFNSYVLYQIRADDYYVFGWGVQEFNWSSGNFPSAQAPSIGNDELRVFYPTVQFGKYPRYFLTQPMISTNKTLTSSEWSQIFQARVPNTLLGNPLLECQTTPANECPSYGRIHQV